MGHAHHHVHYRLPLREGLLILGVGFHIDRKDFARAIVVEVGGIVAHGAVRHDIERCRLLPGAVAKSVVAVFDGEVVADDDLEVALRIDGGQERQGVGALADSVGTEAIAQVFVVDHAGLGRGLSQDFFVFDIVGAGDQIQIAIAVGVQPVHGVGDVADAGEHLCLEALVAEIAPVERGGRLLREDDVEPAVAIDINGRRGTSG